MRTIKKGTSGTAAKPNQRARQLTKEALCLAQTLRPRGGHLPLALVADKLQTRYGYSRGGPVRVKPEKLAASLNVSLSQVKRALGDLQEAKLISFKQQTRHKTKQTYGGSLHEVGKLDSRLDEIYFYMQPPPRPKRCTQARPRVSVEECLEVARADRAAYEADLSATAGDRWGRPRYDEEVAEALRQLKAAEAERNADLMREARADEQASKFEEDIAIEAVVATFMWAVEYVRAAWAVNDARAQAEYEGTDEHEAEARSFAREQFLEELLVNGPTYAVLGIPGWAEALHEHFPEVYAKYFREPGPRATP